MHYTLSPLPFGSPQFPVAVHIVADKLLFVLNSSQLLGFAPIFRHQWPALSRSQQGEYS